MSDYYDVLKKARTFLADPTAEEALQFVQEVAKCLDNNWHNPRVHSPGNLGFPCSVCPWLGHTREEGIHCRTRIMTLEFKYLPNKSTSQAIAKAMEMATVLVAEYPL